MIFVWQSYRWASDVISERMENSSALVTAEPPPMSRKADASHVRRTGKTSGHRPGHTHLAAAARDDKAEGKGSGRTHDEIEGLRENIPEDAQAQDGPAPVLVGQHAVRDGGEHT